MRGRGSLVHSYALPQSKVVRIQLPQLGEKPLVRMQHTLKCSPHRVRLEPIPCKVVADACLLYVFNGENELAGGLAMTVTHKSRLWKSHMEKLIQLDRRRHRVYMQ